MAFNYGRSRSTADRLIAKFGQAVTINRKSQSGPAHNPTITVTPHSATAAIVDFSTNSSHFEGEPILSGDKHAIVAAGGLAIEPTPTTDSMTVGGQIHAIVRVKSINPGGTVVAYEAMLRR